MTLSTQQLAAILVGIVGAHEGVEIGGKELDSYTIAQHTEVNTFPEAINKPAGFAQIAIIQTAFNNNVDTLVDLGWIEKKASSFGAIYNYVALPQLKAWYNRYQSSPSMAIQELQGGESIPTQEDYDTLKEVDSNTIESLPLATTHMSEPSFPNPFGGGSGFGSTPSPFGGVPTETAPMSETPASSPFGGGSGFGSTPDSAPSTPSSVGEPMNPQPSNPFGSSGDKDTNASSSIFGGGGMFGSPSPGGMFGGQTKHANTTDFSKILDTPSSESSTVPSQTPQTNVKPATGGSPSIPGINPFGGAIAQPTPTSTPPNAPSDPSNTPSTTPSLFNTGGGLFGGGKQQPNTVTTVPTVEPPKTTQRGLFSGNANVPTGGSSHTGTGLFSGGAQVPTQPPTSNNPFGAKSAPANTGGGRGMPDYRQYGPRAQKEPTSQSTGSTGEEPALILNLPDGSRLEFSQAAYQHLLDRYGLQGILELTQRLQKGESISNVFNDIDE